MYMAQRWPTQSTLILSFPAECVVMEKKMVVQLWTDYPSVREYYKQSSEETTETSSQLYPSRLYNAVLKHLCTALFLEFAHLSEK